MPAFLTHYSCGVLAYHQLQEGILRSAIKAHTGVYAIGLAGPDLFFYTLGEYLYKGMTVGRIMHKYRTGCFLRTLFEFSMKTAGEDRETALAYLAGFIGHYSLDSNAHHLVYRTCDNLDQKKALGKHFRFEAAMDVFFCRKILGRDINDSHQMWLIRTTHHEKKVIAALLAETIAAVYPDLGRTYSKRRILLTLYEYFAISGCLIDPSGFREWIGQGLERFMIGYPLMSPLFINRNTYGLSQVHEKRFLKCFKRGVRMQSVLMPMLERAICEPGEKTGFFERLGSWSYHGFYHEEADSELPLKVLEDRMFEREAKGNVIP